MFIVSDQGNEIFNADNVISIRRTFDCRIEVVTRDKEERLLGRYTGEETADKAMEQLIRDISEAKKCVVYLLSERDVIAQNKIQT